MDKLYFPQLASGAVAQYPIRKMRVARTIKNVLPDGTMILYSDPDAARLLWGLSYTNLSSGDVEAIQSHFKNCVGPFRAFTFIDPTDNMLLSSSDLRSAVWQTSSHINITPGAGDPVGGSSAFILTNTGQADQAISQVVHVRASYQYCLSVYVNSDQASMITLIRSGSFTEKRTSVPIKQGWHRVVSSGRLNDPGEIFTVAISLMAGQQLEIYGVQLEAQISPSRYRPTMETAGVFPNAHWGIDELTVIAEAPNLFSTSFSIETAI
ncbi:MAG: hypothetical protein ACJ74Z_11120 [Bryobacteraceae bacterium]